MKLFIIAFVVSVASGQYPYPAKDESFRPTFSHQTKNSHILISPATTSWKGPIADHHIGVLPVDTPAVAAAKADHIKAQLELSAVLPQLSEEELNRKDGLSESKVLALQKEGHDELNRLNAAQISLAKASGIPPTRWTGPKADHQLGVLPVDTPAVAAAKADIAKAHQEILSKLPQLSAEELYRKDGLSESAVLALQREGHDELNRLNAAQISLTKASDIPPTPWTGPKANHQLGVLPLDTPAVAAAKADIAKVHQDILAVLPPLPVEELYRKDGLSESAVLALQKEGLEELSRLNAFQISLAKASGIQPTPWTGPKADHQLGVLPVDTPEVAAAKADIAKAHQDILAVLPPLTAEEIYRKDGLSESAVLALQKEGHDELSRLNAVQISLAKTLGIPPTPWTGPKADHQLGVLPVDTSAVAAAKADIAKAHQDILAVLPPLPAEGSYVKHKLSLSEVISLQQQGHEALNRAQIALAASAASEIPTKPWTGPIADHKLGQLPKETLEVAAAKADHLRARQELLTRFPELSALAAFQQQGAFNNAQISSFKSVASAPSISTQRWTGAIADHKIGELPIETPAVAAARAEHTQAQRELLSKLPVLPTEQRYIKEGLNLPAVLTLQKQGHEELNRAQIALAAIEAASNTPIKPWKGPFATHQLGVHPGDTPEVASAKTDHLNAYQKALKVLPQLPATVVQSRLSLPYPSS